LAQRTGIPVWKEGNQLLKGGVPVVHAPSSTNGAHASQKPHAIQIAVKENVT
jgi:hypothetical protein